MLPSARRSVFRAVMRVTDSAGFSPCAANAQSSAFRGKFTLPYEVRWGGAVLQPGSYTLSVQKLATCDAVAIRDSAGHLVAYRLGGVRDNSNEGTTALLVRSRGAQRVVHFRIAELGELLVYDATLARGRHISEEASTTQTVSILQAKK